METHLPATLKQFEMTAAKNNSDKGWIVGQNVSRHVTRLLSNCACILQVTCADMAIAVMLDVLSKSKPDLIQLFANLSKLKKSVEELPNIERWIANRPDSAH